MFYLNYRFVANLLNTYTISVVLFSLCVILLWEYLRILYYMAKVPGAEGWRIIRNALILKDITRAETYFQVFKEQGSFFKIWFGPIPAVAICDPQILQSFYTNPSSLNKGRLFRWTMSHLLKDSIITTNVEKWKRNRKICNYGFSQTILNSFLPIFNDVNDSLIEQLKKEVNKTKPFDVFLYLRLATLDSICATAMGINLNNLKITKSPYAEALDRVVAITIQRMCTIWLYPNFIFNLTSLAKEQNDGMKILWNTTNKVFDIKLESMNNNESNSIRDTYTNLNEPIEKNPLKKPFLDFLLDMVELYPEFTVEQLKEEVNVIIMGGYETVAVTLSYALVALGARKDIQQKAYEEVFSVFGNSTRSVQLEDLSKLKYVEMVLKETLRLYPPIAHIIREITDDMIIGNYKIPVGTTIYISILATHRNPKYWENPAEFNPERFQTIRHPYAYIPFSSGPRNCIGVKYAMMFMKIIIANILRNYEVHTDLKLDELDFEIDISLKLIGGHLITITERQKNSFY